MTSSANAGQAEYWNSPAAQQWIAFQDILDVSLAGVLDRLLELAPPAPGERVLDVGCGTGASTFAAGRAVGEKGRVTGVDISEQFLERARARLAVEPTAVVEFIRADAQVHDFPPGAVDLAISRFGVMFFEDPVAAFANIRRALRPGGRLAFVAWAPIDGNPWFRVPRDAAVARLGRPVPVPPDAPGPLAFADIGRVRGILQEAGFADVWAAEEELSLAHPGGLDAVAPLVIKVGPAARIANELGASDEDRAAIAKAVLDGLRRYDGPGGIRVPGRFNFFRAVAGPETRLGAGA